MVQAKNNPGLARNPQASQVIPAMMTRTNSKSVDFLRTLAASDPTLAAEVLEMYDNLLTHSNNTTKPTDAQQQKKPPEHSLSSDDIISDLSSVGETHGRHGGIANPLSPSKKEKRTKHVSIVEEQRNILASSLLLHSLQNDEKMKKVKQSHPTFHSKPTNDRPPKPPKHVRLKAVTNESVKQPLPPLTPPPPRPPRPPTTTTMDTRDPPVQSSSRMVDDGPRDGPAGDASTKKTKTDNDDKTNNGTGSEKEPNFDEMLSTLRSLRTMVKSSASLGPSLARSMSQRSDPLSVEKLMSSSSILSNETPIVSNAAGGGRAAAAENKYSGGRNTLTPTVVNLQTTAMTPKTVMTTTVTKIAASSVTTSSERNSHVGTSTSTKNESLSTRGRPSPIPTASSSTTTTTASSAVTAPSKAFSGQQHTGNMAKMALSLTSQQRSETDLSRNNVGPRAPTPPPQGILKKRLQADIVKSSAAPMEANQQSLSSNTSRNHSTKATERTSSNNSKTESRLQQKAKATSSTSVGKRKTENSHFKKKVERTSSNDRIMKLFRFRSRRADRNRAIQAAISSDSSKNKTTGKSLSVVIDDDSTSSSKRSVKANKRSNLSARYGLTKKRSREEFNKKGFGWRNKRKSNKVAKSAKGPYNNRKAEDGALSYAIATTSLEATSSSMNATAAEDQVSSEAIESAEEIQVKKPMTLSTLLEVSTECGTSDVVGQEHYTTDCTPVVTTVQPGEDDDEEEEEEEEEGNDHMVLEDNNGAVKQKTFELEEMNVHEAKIEGEANATAIDVTEAVLSSLSHDLTGIQGRLLQYVNNSLIDEVRQASADQQDGGNEGDDVDPGQNHRTKALQILHGLLGLRNRGDRRPVVIPEAEPALEQMSSSEDEWKPRLPPNYPNAPSEEKKEEEIPDKNFATSFFSTIPSFLPKTAREKAMEARNCKEDATYESSLIPNLPSSAEYEEIEYSRSSSGAGDSNPDSFAYEGDSRSASASASLPSFKSVEDSFEEGIWTYFGIGGSQEGGRRRKAAGLCGCR